MKLVFICDPYVLCPSNDVCVYLFSVPLCFQTTVTAERKRDDECLLECFRELTLRGE